MSGELLVIFVVALLVFNPKKLPMLAHHLGLLVRKVNHIKEQVVVFWQRQIAEQELLENEKKAQRVDLLYRNNHKKTH